MNPFANSILILGTLAQLALIASAAEEQPSVGNSYRREDSAWAPRIAGSLQVSSGDSSLHGSRLETFNPIFPAGYYYGGPLNEQIGPKNAIILQPEVDLHPTATLLHVLDQMA